MSTVTGLLCTSQRSHWGMFPSCYLTLSLSRAKPGKGKELNRIFGRILWDCQAAYFLYSFTRINGLLSDSTDSWLLSLSRSLLFLLSRRPKNINVKSVFVKMFSISFSRSRTAPVFHLLGRDRQYDQQWRRRQRSTFYPLHPSIHSFILLYVQSAELSV